MNIEWYSKYVFLFGAILSFADPVTDVLTLERYYLTGRKTWFAVGLGFQVLPWFPFGFYYVTLKRSLMVSTNRRPTLAWIRSFLVGFNPFSVAVARLEMFVACLKSGGSGRFHEEDFLYNQVAEFFEAVLESAPQFVIQLYVLSVQDETVSTIQMISLPVSFLSLVWSYTSTEELWNNADNRNHINVKHKVLLFVTYLFLLSSRLFAVAHFTVSYKWWIVSVLMLHSIIMAILGYIFSSRHGHRRPFTFTVAVELFGKFCVQWIRDNIPIFPLKTKNTVTMPYFANVLFVVENVLMILLFYFSGHSRIRYALPVTVCMCTFTVFGAIMRITHLYFLQKTKQAARKLPVVPQLEMSTIQFTNFEQLYYCYESTV